MFLRILSDHQQYQPKILAMPNPTEEQIKEEGIVDGPWVIELDQLLTDHECGRLIELGKKSGYQPSTGLGKPRLDGFYDNISISGRTSANTWCVDDCMNNEVPKKVEAKIASVLGIPTPNSEYLQLLQYDVGQFYESHHDFIE
jgi:prolyl 4-hydroxylase